MKTPVFKSPCHKIVEDTTNMDSVDTRGKIIDLEELHNQNEGTVTLHFTPTTIESIDKVFLLDFVSEKRRASLYLEVVKNEPFLSVRAEHGDFVEWKQKVEWKNNQKVFIAVSWDMKEGYLKVFVDEQPFKAINLKSLGFDNIGQKLVIGSDYENHYPGNFNISM
ncbi:MAG: hypothetical protein HYS81_01400 [Candidatus Aenigmatarchaeota archaeon]|nr:MAG: hypothetical protein HYS81_01400 [Candidatus Aenigmarchaeota archaeon]